MKFKYELYHYQKDILNTFEKEIKRGDKKIHIVAPPGSGKTIMGLEMISRLGGNHLILVPNITLQYQWKDKLERMFLDKGENIDDLISTSREIIKKINIITYQSLTQTSENEDLIYDILINYWFRDYKSEFKNIEKFINYVNGLKENEQELYGKYINKYKKILKNKDEASISKILSEKIIDYINRLKVNNIKSIVLDEAHHLTSWWSKAVYHIWQDLGIYNSRFDLNTSDESKYPFAIGLTATPPYDDADFFILDDDYTKLLGEVDYYVATPAVIKSGRLAPYSDLVYFVEPDKTLKIEIEKNDKLLNDYIEKDKENICNYLIGLIKKEYDILINKKYKLLLNYLKFIKSFSSLDISEYYFDEKIGENIYLEDISKSIGKYISYLSLNGKNKEEINSIKKLFYDLGYIWRTKNFYKFRTKLEQTLIYSKSKINGIKAILNKETKNLGTSLKGVIITDFLEETDSMISCKFILKNLNEFSNLNPILVSGQGCWNLENGEIKVLDINILEATDMLETGKTKLLIGTRGILGEGWDCPKLNTLIDLTGIMSYMSVNQVRGRAIRLDDSNSKKVANIYDIVTIYEGHTKEVDMNRLKRKHEQFYGVDDNGLIIKGVNHIYPNLINNSKEYKTINENMLKRSELRSYYYELWGIGKNYENKEIFGIDIEINDLGRYIPFVNFSTVESFKFFKMIKSKEDIRENIESKFYKILIEKFLEKLLINITNTQKKIGILANDFKYKLIKQEKGYKLISDYKDDLIVKRFMLDISVIFREITTQRYILKYPFVIFEENDMKEAYLCFGLPESLSKNYEIRKIFLRELENNKSKYKSIKNIGTIYDKFIKTSIVLPSFIGSFFLLSLMSFDYIVLFYYFAVSVGLTSIYKLDTIFYNKRTNIIKKYKNSLIDFIKRKKELRIKFIYLLSTKVKKDKYIGKKSLFNSKIEKLWI